MSGKRMYRCTNGRCAVDPAGREIFDFASEDGTCPKCGAGPNHPNPRVRGLVFRLELVHFDPPSEFPGVGLNHAACDPKKPIGTTRGTGDPGAVTCPVCKETLAFKETAAKWDYEVIPEGDREMTLHPATGEGELRRIDKRPPPASPCE